MAGFAQKGETRKLCIPKLFTFLLCLAGVVTDTAQKLHQDFKNRLPVIRDSVQKSKTFTIKNCILKLKNYAREIQQCWACQVKNQTMGKWEPHTRYVSTLYLTHFFLIAHGFQKSLITVQVHPVCVHVIKVCGLSECDLPWPSLTDERVESL